MNTVCSTVRLSLVLVVLLARAALAADSSPPRPRGEAAAAEPATQAARWKCRRVLYNDDGSAAARSVAARGTDAAPLASGDVRPRIEEVAYAESRVDTVLLCINAQSTYYPTKVGTMTGTPPSPSDGNAASLKALFDAGVDPYAVMLAETKRRGREALLSFRMNDDHGADFQTTQFWVDHPECRLGRKALDFDCEEVRDYVARLIEEAVRRYDCDGIELDFNRFPTFFKDGATDERLAKMNSLVKRVRETLDEVGRARGRHLVLAVRVPSNYNRTPPTPETARQLGCDVAAWAGNGWLDFVVVSEWLHERGDLPVNQWKGAITAAAVYFGIECAWPASRRAEMGRTYLSADDYRRAADRLVKAGADGVYLFNFFCGPDPPFEVLCELGK